MKSRIIRVLAVLAVAFGAAFIAPSVDAATPPPPPASWPCEAYPNFVTAPAGKLTVKFTLQCERNFHYLRVSPVIEMDTGKSSTSKTYYGKENQCANTNKCTTTMTITNPSGTQTFYALNEPTTQGTMVSHFLEGSDHYCNQRDFINCTRVVKKA